MRALVVIAAFVASLIGCGGPEAAPAPSASVEVSESPLTTTQTYRGSYQCGPDWWHVEQTIQTTSVLARNGATQITASLPLIAAVDDPTANAAMIWCFNSNPSPMVWGGVSYYNTANMGATPSSCIMWTHRANQPWQSSATVAITAGGGLQLSRGSPTTWLLQVQNTGGGGPHDGLAACGGSFYLALQ